MKKNLIIGVPCLVVGLLCGLLLRGCNRPTGGTPEPIEVHDTFFRVDTVVKEKIRWKSRTVKDTLVTVRRDSLIDTVRVEIPIDHKQFRDTFGNDSVRATIDIAFSGYNAIIDSAKYFLDVNIPREVVVKENGWSPFVGVAISGGYGVSTIDRRLYGSPTVALTLSIGWGYHWKPKRKR